MSREATARRSRRGAQPAAGKQALLFPLLRGSGMPFLSPDLVLTDELLPPRALRNPTDIASSRKQRTYFFKKNRCPFSLWPPLAVTSLPFFVHGNTSCVVAFLFWKEEGKTLEVAVFGLRRGSSFSPVAFPSPLLRRALASRFATSIFILPISLCRRRKRKAAHQTWLSSDAGTAEKWATAINDNLRGIGSSDKKEGVREDGVDVGIGIEQSQGGPEVRQRRQRRLLVLVNPVSGTGGSRSIFNNTLRLVKVLAAGRGGSWW